MIEAPVIANFSHLKEIVIQSDVSKYCLGYCLLQEGKPVFYASQSLNETELNYAQVEKESLAIAHTVKKILSLFMEGKLKC